MFSAGPRAASALYDVVGLKDSLHTATGELLAAKLQEVVDHLVLGHGADVGLHVQAHDWETIRHALDHQETIRTLFCGTQARAKMLIIQGSSEMWGEVTSLSGHWITWSGLVVIGARIAAPSISAAPLLPQIPQQQSKQRG